MPPDDWPPVSPPLEAYSRVTDPGRFGSLRQLALDLLARLEAEFDVSRAEVFDLPPGLESVEQARSPIRLTPALPTAAPIAVVFTTFPSLIVRFGRCVVESFPTCGCDACAETGDAEGERLQAMVGDVVSGQFRERVTMPLLGDATLEWELGVPDAVTGHRGGWTRMRRSRARALLGGGPRVVQWTAWPARAHSAL